MAEQKKKTTSTKKKSTAKAKTAGKTKAKAKAKPKGIPAVLKTAAKGWRKVETKRIELLEDSVSRYFDARHSMLDAKSVKERAQIGREFTREAVVRELENFRKLNKVRAKAGRDTLETLWDVVPEEPRKAVDAIWDRVPKVKVKAKAA